MTDGTALEPETVSRDSLIASARSLFPLLRAEAETAEKARRISDTVFAKLRDAGICRTLVPRRYGGYEFEPAVVARIVMELAAACGSTGWVASCAMSHQWMVAQFPIPCQEEVWRDHPDKMVSTSFPPSGDCIRADDGYRISGTWRYASGCDHADYVLLGVVFPPSGEDGAPVPGFVIAPMSECTLVEDWDTMGLAATGSHAVRAEDVLIPAYRSISMRDFVAAETPGCGTFETNLGRYPVFSVGAHGLAATALGCLRGALDEFLAGLTGRRASLMAGGGAKVADFASVQMRIGKAEAAMKAAEALLFRQMEESRQAAMERGELLDTDARIANRVAQAYATQLAVQGLEELWGAAGAAGIRNAEIVQRAWRDAHAVAHHAFFNWDAVSSLAGRHRIGLDPGGPF